jgi:hypothetical protein
MSRPPRRREKLPKRNAYTGLITILLRHGHGGVSLITIDEFLRRPTWVCQWRCPFMGEVNRTRNQDLPPGIKSIDDLLAHLICHSCKMNLKEIPLIHIVVHATCPAAIPQNKKFIIHFWPEEP